MLAQHLHSLAAQRPAALLCLAAHCPDWIAHAQGLTQGNVCAILACQEATMPIPRLLQPTPPQDPWRDLAAAVLLQAIRDARSDSERIRHSARRWLTSQAGQGYCHLFNLEPEAVCARLCYTVGDAPLGGEGEQWPGKRVGESATTTASNGLGNG